MPDRRGSRFILEVLFLLGLAVALTMAKLDPLEIAGIMLLGWLIVAMLEWAAWRGEPHYGSGLPPRYYVPTVNLPPAQPLEQVHAGYPGSQRDEAPTWIASAAVRAEVLGEWPHAEAAPAETAPAGAGPAPPEIDDTDEDPWTIVALPAAPLGELEPEPDLQPDPQPVAAAQPEPAPKAEPTPRPVAVPEPSLDVELARSVQGVARYSLDPLGDPPPRRRFGRGGVETAPAIEVPARPDGVRALPGRSSRQD
jgi:hypothetical protein